MKQDKISLDLQVHLYLEKYHPEHVIKTMQNNNLDVIAAMTYNFNVFSHLLDYKKDLTNKGYEVENDSILMRITDKRTNIESFMLKSQEVSTSDDYHVLVYGGNTIPYETLRETIDRGLERGLFVAIDHPFVDVTTMKKPISNKKITELRKICKKYNNKIALEWNGYCINWIWDVLKKRYGINANEAVLDFSNKLKNEGYNLPVFTDTDVHARNKLGLGAIGTSRILIPRNNIDFSSGPEFIYSLKDSILNEKHENTYKTVGNIHFGFYFAIPQIFNKFFKRVRG